MSSKRKTPDLLWEVGCGRRVRGSANLVNMLGGILPEKRNESMILRAEYSVVRVSYALFIACSKT